jgi:hypothetical protein
LNSNPSGKVTVPAGPTQVADPENTPKKTTSGHQPFNQFKPTTSPQITDILKTLAFTPTDEAEHNNSSAPTNSKVPAETRGMSPATQSLHPLF